MSKVSVIVIVQGRGRKQDSASAEMNGRGWQTEKIGPNSQPAVQPVVPPAVKCKHCVMQCKHCVMQLH